MREGVRLGLIVGAATWLWIVGYDFAAGNPFYSSAILFEAGFAGLTALIANMGLGQLAWGRIFFGNAMAAGLTYALVAHNHPMRELYLAAEARQKD